MSIINWLFGRKKEQEPVVTKAGVGTQAKAELSGLKSGLRDDEELNRLIRQIEEVASSLRIENKSDVNAIKRLGELGNPKAVDVLMRIASGGGGVFGAEGLIDVGGAAEKAIDKIKTAVSAKDSDGWTVLMRAYRERHTDEARVLIEKGADINAKDDHGKTALMRASGEGHTYTDSRDGHVYKIVKIGDQLWMAENLSYIPHVSPPEEQGGIWVLDYKGNNVAEAKITKNYLIYGCLYDWKTAKKVVPEGWHLPSDHEWKQLSDFLGENAGTKLKSKTNWNGIDLYDFSALPGCDRSLLSTGGGYFEKFGRFGHWWSSTETEYMYAWYRRLFDSSDELLYLEYNKKCGLSVRCLKD